ncbi:MAG: GGDEF domain-containing protein [Candidatus Dormiibacterota bacterium]
MTTVQAPEKENRQDELTQLLNRRGIHALAETVPDRVYGVLVIDIDNFAEFNYQYGHRVGDAALVEFAKRLTDAVGGEGELARIAGEEFMAVLPNATLDTACALAERVCEGLRG